MCSGHLLLVSPGYYLLQCTGDSKFGVRIGEAIRVVMADKDLKERDVIKQCLPNAVVLICLFHTLRTFRREVSCEKLGISSGQRTMCLELLQKMVYAATDDEYTRLYTQF